MPDDELTKLASRVVALEEDVSLMKVGSPTNDADAIRNAGKIIKDICNRITCIDCPADINSKCVFMECIQTPKSWDI